MLKTSEIIRQFVRDTTRYNNLYPNSSVSITVPASGSYNFTVDYLPQYTDFFVQFKFSNTVSANLTISDGTNSETATYKFACGILIDNSITTITITNNETIDIQIDGIAYYNINDIDFDDTFIGQYLFNYDNTGIKNFVYSQTEVYTTDGTVFKPNQFFAYIMPFISFKKFIGDFYLGGSGTNFDIISASQISGSTYGIVPAFDISGVNLSNLRVLTQSTNGFSAKISQVGSNPNEIEIITYKNGQPTAVDTLTKFILKVA